MANPVRIGLVGLGRAGWGMHLEELKGKEDKCVIVAACDIIPERLEKMKERFPEVHTYDKIEDLIHDPDVELVSIATRSCDHYKHVKMALLAGKYAVAFWVLFVIVGLVGPTILETWMLFFSPKEFEESRKAHAISAMSDIGVLIGGFMLRLLVLIAALPITMVTPFVL